MTADGNDLICLPGCKSHVGDEPGDSVVIVVDQVNILHLHQMFICYLFILCLATNLIEVIRDIWIEKD